MSHELVLVLDFGGQYNQLIARRVREHKIYCEVKSYKTPIEEIRAMNPKGIIFTGGPNSVYLENSPRMSKEIFELGVPVLGICYGVQFMAYSLGGEIGTAVDSSLSEFGRTETEVDTTSLLFKNIDKTTITWMSHNDYIKKLPEGFEVCGHTAKCPYAAIQNVEKKFYGVQFHPEVNHTEYGQAMLRNFLYEVCGATGDWTMGDFMRKSIEDIRANYAGLYGVEELSERLGVSKSHLVRTFTAAIGVPPGRYLTTVRIEAAQRLLLHREYTLDVVASLCGFSGANYLCRVFKKETGQSPAQWRAMAGHAAQSGLSPEESLREQELYI